MFPLGVSPVRRLVRCAQALPGVWVGTGVRRKQGWKETTGSSPLFFFFFLL